MLDTKTAKVSGDFRTMNIQRKNDTAFLSLSADEAKDLIRMLALAHHVDEAILEADIRQVEAFQTLFARAVETDPDNIVVQTSKSDFHKLSFIIGGVNVVDPDAFYTDKGLDMVSEKRMEELSDAMTEMTDQISDLPRVSAITRKPVI